MKKHISKVIIGRILVISMLIIISLNVFPVNSDCPIIPLPQTYSKVEEVFVLSNRTVILYDKEFKKQSFLLQNNLLKKIGIGVVLSEYNEKNVFSNDKVYIEIKKGVSVYKKPESYNIQMTSNKVIIISETDEGISHGLYSFLQLAMLSTKKGGIVNIDCWNIVDFPLYEWRGFMLDESRHFFGAKKVKQILDWMALYKLNKFHWHLTDTPGWRIEIKKYPLLGSVGGVGSFSQDYIDMWDPTTPTKYYTQEEIKEIVRYASERFIEIIPEIDMPGHASAATRAYPEFSGGGNPPRFPGYTFNPGKDTVYTFLTEVLREVDVLFPSQIIHLGGDEVHYGDEGWKTDKSVQNLMKKENLENIKEVESYFFNRIADSLFNLNNRLAAWDEIADANFPPEKTIIYFWRPNRLDQLQKSLDKGYSIVFSPRLPMYLDYSQDTLQVHGVPWKKFGVNSYDKIYNFSVNEFDVKYPKHIKILGIQANLWTERVFTESRLDYMLFPRITALAESAWTEEENKNLDSFNKRLKKQFELYQKDGVYYYNPFEPRLTGEPVR
jgi:hexosaminidase